MGTFTQVMGWIGTFLIVSAYFLVSTRKVTGTSRLYQLMNIAGSVGIGINVYQQRAWPAVCLQVIWIAIAVFAIIRGRGRIIHGR